MWQVVQVTTQTTSWTVRDTQHMTKYLVEGSEIKHAVGDGRRREWDPKAAYSFPGQKLIKPNLDICIYMANEIPLRKLTITK